MFDSVTALNFSSACSLIIPSADPTTAALPIHATHVDHVHAQLSREQRWPPSTARPPCLLVNFFPLGSARRRSPPPGSQEQQQRAVGQHPCASSAVKQGWKATQWVCAGAALPSIQSHSDSQLTKLVRGLVMILNMFWPWLYFSRWKGAVAVLPTAEPIPDNLEMFLPIFGLDLDSSEPGAGHCQGNVCLWVRLQSKVQCKPTSCMLQ